MGGFLFYIDQPLFTDLEVIANKASVKSLNHRFWHYFMIYFYTIWFTPSFNPIEPNLDDMKMKTILVVAISIMLFASCSRYITVQEAANGKAKCGRSLR